MKTMLLLPLHAHADFDPAQTLDCGQAFRFMPTKDGWWEGVVGNHVCGIAAREGGIAVECACTQDCSAFWRHYFDLDRDYGALKARLSTDAVMKKAVEYSPGMRMLRQDGWEALCSFLLSQNNHIKRIKSIIQTLCISFGASLGDGAYAFPTPEAVASLSPEQLAVLRAGYRADYIRSAAQQVVSGTLDLQALYTMPLDQARQALLCVRGVGPKVADCALLFGFARDACFPRDVWIRRAVVALYPDGFPQAFADVAGIAQQYLFHYCRTCPGALSGINQGES